MVGGDLYVGGIFQSVGGTAANNIAKWNGTSWSALGAGIGIAGGLVSAMAPHGSDLYVHGAGAVFRWDGSQWSSVGSPFNDELPAMGVAGEYLYVVGGSGFGIRRWRIGSSGTDWEKLADGVAGTVYSMAVVGQDLFVGGSFSAAGGVAGTRNIARWRLGSTGNAGWSALGTGVGGDVRALAATGEHLYVGGDFTSVAGATRNYIIRWTLGGTDDNSWAPMGSGLGGPFGVRALAIVGNELFVGGGFTSAGGQAGRSHIAKWTLGGTGNSSWAAVGSGISDLAGVNGAGVWSMAAAANGDLFFGGNFTIAGDKAVGNVAKLVTASDVTLSGAVKYYPGGAGGPTVPQTMVALTGGPGGSVSTPADGTFSFKVPSGGSYTLTPTRNGDNPGNQGVSTLDITLIRRHILATTRLDSAHKVIAADANKSASVTTVDISLIRRLILGIDSKLAAGAWRFIPASHTFSDAQSPWGYPETHSYTGLNAGATGQDFVAVKVGDVNNSWTVGLPLAASAAESARAAVRPAAEM